MRLSANRSASFSRRSPKTSGFAGGPTIIAQPRADTNSQAVESKKKGLQAMGDAMPQNSDRYMVVDKASSSQQQQHLPQIFTVMMSLLCRLRLAGWKLSSWLLDRCGTPLKSRQQKRNRSLIKGFRQFGLQDFRMVKGLPLGQGWCSHCIVV